ncbi:dihydrodipicolinate synthase family protein [Streptomyces sp. NPDC020800]|uniref:dihydrodipicolinate synthase family protein n=1 Tax=Streptomyces sp. NPDC020800 TaxID=3365092 RepID=UPI003795118F
MPCFTQPSQAGVPAHFTHLVNVSLLPLIIYHIPYRTGQPLDAPTLRAPGRLPQVAGVKLAQGSTDQETGALVGDLPPGFAVLTGDDLFPSPCWRSAHKATS